MISRYRNAIDQGTALEHVAEWHPNTVVRVAPGEEIAPEDCKLGVWLKVEVFEGESIIPAFAYLFSRAGV